ncbi:hypothetical protein MNB_SUP05-SYMBIONT-7-666 [hydrothermal vent metagenome]|uniref:Peptidase C-terminal archaeal/bacterial domain-containing protein n=1 Tax=hydrothermal vent metagenome TaxID=652676 RepID=A0A1W1E640_9ZZZZ
MRGVYDASGHMISGTTNDDTNDDSGQSLNSRLDFSTTEAGTYYISAGAYGVNIGTYSLSIDDMSII